MNWAGGDWTTLMSTGNGMAKLAAWSAVIVAAIGALIWVGTLSSDVRQNTQALDGIYRRLSMIEDQNRMNLITIAELQRDEREIETQFCASDIVRNLMHATDMRNFSIVWKKLYKEEYPITNAYYPQVCNRPSGK